MSELKKTTMPILGPNKHCFGSGFFCLDLDWTFFPESKSGSGQNPDPLKNAFLFWFLQNLIKEHNKDLSKLLTNPVIFGLKFYRWFIVEIVYYFQKFCIHFFSTGVQSKNRRIWIQVFKVQTWISKKPRSIQIRHTAKNMCSISIFNFLFAILL